MKLSEIFDAPYSADIEKDDYHDYVARAKLPDGSPLSITFEKYDAASYAVAFSKNFQYDATHEGDAYKIFATVLTTIKTFIERVQPYEIHFLAEKDEYGVQNSEVIDSNSRIKLYDRMVKKYADKLGYKLDRSHAYNAIQYKLTRSR